jgi:hypothetical protein
VITSNQINSYGESFSPAEQAQAVGCLREWARHDTWTVNEGLRLLAGIDPHHSQDLTFDSEGFATVSNPSWAKIIEKPGGTWDDATGPRVTGYYLDLTQFVLLGEMLSSWVARVSHTMQDRHPPRYFIEWASEKGWHPFWLTWAQQAGLFLNRADSQPQAAPVVEAGATPWHLLATPAELIDAFGRFTGMDKAWFNNVKDTPKLKAALHTAGQGGRNGREPLYCVLPVMQWLADPKRRKGRPMGEASGWRVLEHKFPKVHEEYLGQKPDTE